MDVVDRNNSATSISFEKLNIKKYKNLKKGGSNEVRNSGWGSAQK
jgi:hypothetical protein